MSRALCAPRSCGRLLIMGLLRALRGLDEGVLGPGPGPRFRQGAMLPYVWAGVLCGGVPALVVVLLDGPLLVAALLLLFGPLPVGIALLTRPPRRKPRRR